MARGTGNATVTKDPDAQAEFRKRHGIINADVPVGNAEALQRAVRASSSRAVQKASLLPINNEATADLDLDELSGKLGDDEVVAAAVRGNAIVVVAEDANGRAYKTVLPANDSYKAPKEEAEDAAAREQAKAEISFHEEVAKIRQEAEAEVAKLRDELANEMKEAIEKAKEEILGKASENADKAAADAEDNSGDDSETQAPAPNDPKQGGGPKTKKSQ